MPDPDKDNLADALAALASGQTGDSDAAQDPSPPPKSPPVARPTAPVPPRPRMSDPTQLLESEPLETTERPAPLRPPQHMGSKLNTRRTLIPILLTGGVLLCVFGALKYITGPDSPFAGLPMSVIIPAFVMGALLLIAAFINMMNVNSAEEQSR